MPLALPLPADERTPRVKNHNGGLFSWGLAMCFQQRNAVGPCHSAPHHSPSLFEPVATAEELPEERGDRELFSRGLILAPLAIPLLS